jgi:hypothetical protein
MSSFAARRGEVVDRPPVLLSQRFGGFAQLSGQGFGMGAERLYSKPQVG